MARQVIFSDDLSNYYSSVLKTPFDVKNAVAKTYSKSWSLVSGVDGGKTIVNGHTVDYRILPYPDVKFGDLVVTKVDVSSKGGILFITFR